ncbi:MAG: CDP-diacylglycerol--serine O-phosphatidyltransferase [Leptospirales bacterium]
MEHYPSPHDEHVDEIPAVRHRGRGIYILPNLFTAGNLFFGFYSILAGFDHRYRDAAFAILIAAVFDNLDGKVARLARATSAFGVEFDSLADLVSFGAAPALLVYNSDLFAYHRLGMAAAFLFLACGALRLARFNVMTSKISSKYFLGLPIPAGALVIVSAELARTGPLSHAFSFPPGFFLLATYLVAILMVSPLRYRSFKEARLMRRPLTTFVTVMILALSFVLYPTSSLFVGILLYTALGPVEYLLYRSGFGAPVGDPGEPLLGWMGGTVKRRGRIVRFRKPGSPRGR